MVPANSTTFTPTFPRLIDALYGESSGVVWFHNLLLPSLRGVTPKNLFQELMSLTLWINLLFSSTSNPKVLVTRK